MINKDAISPIDVLPCEICCIGLSGTGLVKQFIVRATLCIFLRSDDCPMFFGSDRSFALASDFRPRAFCQDGPREPTEINRQIVKSAEIMCDTVAVGVNDCEEVGSGGLDERFIADGMVRFAAKTAGASLLRCRNSMGRHFI